MDWIETEGVRCLRTHAGRAEIAFSSRLGGCSEGDFESLNLGVLTDDDTTSVLENRRRLSRSLGLDPDRFAIGRQIHGAEIAVHQGVPDQGSWAHGEPQPAEGDGQVVSEPDCPALVFVADCLPIAVAGERSIGMLHGGWRGLAAGIVGRGVQTTEAVIGPGVGPCCFEVGDEVLRAFSPLGPGLAEGRMLDLPEVARRLLERAGVERIESAGICTRCEPELFFSHRGQGPRTGRQAGLAWIDAEA